MGTVINAIRKYTYEEYIKMAKEKIYSTTREEMLLRLKEAISNYEVKYRMTSEEFVPQYERGEFEMDERYLDYELLDWAGKYRRFRQLSVIKENGII